MSPQKIFINKKMSLKFQLHVSVYVFIFFFHSSMGKVCHSQDIRNQPEHLENLRGCNVIEGFLQILLMDHATNADFQNLSFPELREITCYLIVFRVNGIASLGQLFPNLAVIRGNSLFQDYALVVYEVPDLQAIGLWNLVKIQRGAVRIEKNSNLCYTDTVDWSALATGVHVIAHNKGPGCPECEGCLGGRCWDQEHCQEAAAAGDCHPQCLGGCDGDGPRRCVTCRNVLVDGECRRTCPPDKLKWLDRRCITEAECRGMQDAIQQELEANGKYPSQEVEPSWPFNGSCVRECPPGTQLIEGKEFQCQKCEGRCRKVCKGYQLVDSISSAQQFRGCTVINGSLEILILSGTDVLLQELEESLENIEEITGYLKVYRSNPLTSLNFLKNLRIIHGQELDNMKYSLVVRDNPNLQELWDWDSRENKNIQIKAGLIFFHYNPKLCLHHITKLQEIAGMKNSTAYKEASDISNGYQVACNIINVAATISVKYSTSVVIQWDLNVTESLIWCVVYYTAAPYKNVTYHDGQDSCGFNGWYVTDVHIRDEPDDSTPIRRFSHILTKLEPFTQYAFYIETYASSGVQSQSLIQYFSTLPSRPSMPQNFRASSKSSTETVLEWAKPDKPNGILSHYLISGLRLQDDTIFTDERNYCAHDLNTKNSNHRNSKPTFSKIKNSSSNCDAPKEITDLKEYFQFCQNDDGWNTECGVYVHSYLHNDSSIIDNETLDFDTFPSQEMKPFVSQPWGQSDKSNRTNSYGEYEQFWMQVDSNVTSVVISPLHNFAKYVFKLTVCRESYESDNVITMKNDHACSFTSMITHRTAASPTADIISSKNLTVHQQNDTVYISWKHPSNPNGAILSYHVEYFRIDLQNSKPTVECLTKSEHDASGGIYVLKDLPAGTYAIRVSATTLAGMGNYSGIQYVEIKEKNVSVSIEAIIGLSFGMCFICLVSFVIYWKKMQHDKMKLKLYASVNPDYVSEIDDTYKKDEWEIPRENVELLKELGQGSFGMVYEGVLKTTTVHCAVKMVSENATTREKMEFLNEASVMKSFAGAYHIVQLLGVVSKGQPAMVIMELMEKGDLKTYLRMARDDNSIDNECPSPDMHRLFRIAAEIADGMAYLEASKFVHRDLAARNCMVGGDLTVKIGDFGMTRDIYENDYYRKGSKGFLPVRWMAPESLGDGVFSSQSDVWSFGVVLWEIITFAEQPYQGCSNEQVLQFVLSGGTLSKPSNCPDIFYNLMEQCWQWRPSKRPSFFQLIRQLEETCSLPTSFKERSFYHSKVGNDVREGKLINLNRDMSKYLRTNQSECPIVQFYHTREGVCGISWKRDESEDTSLLSEKDNLVIQPKDTESILLTNETAIHLLPQLRKSDDSLNNGYVLPSVN